MRQFTKQKEGVEAYQKAGLKYELEVLEIEFDKWLANTTNEPLSTEDREDEEKWASEIGQPPIDGKNRFIHSVTRIQVGDKEYLVHDEKITRYDQLGNKRRGYRAELGIYPTPEIHYRRELDIDKGTYKNVIDYVQPVATYSIPFTKENFDKLSKLFVSGDPNPNEDTKFYVKRDRLITARSAKDLRDAEFKHLWRFGHFPSAAEKQIFDDEEAGKFPPGYGPGNRPYS